MGANHKNFLAYSNEVDAIAKNSKDKVIHADLKEAEFDDIILGAVAPNSQTLRDSIATHSLKLTEYTEYQITVKAEPLQVDQLLRVSFWEEVNDALANGRQISETKIWKGVCSSTYWYKVRDHLEWKMAYVLCPLMSYAKANKLGLHLGLKAMIEILNVSAVNKDGTVNVKLAQLQQSVFNEVKDRVYGKAVNRIQAHTTTETTSNKDKETIEDLQREIAMLEGSRPQAITQTEPVTIDVVNE